MTMSSEYLKEVLQTIITMYHAQQMISIEMQSHHLQYVCGIWQLCLQQLIRCTNVNFVRKKILYNSTIKPLIENQSIDQACQFSTMY